MFHRNRSETARAYSALAVGVICIGWSAIFVKLAGVPGPASAFYRMLISGLVLIPWRLIRGGSWPRRNLIFLIIAGGAFYALDLALWNTSLLLTSAAIATLLANNAPLWVGFGALFLFRERLTRGYWLGLFISLSGMVILMGLNAWRHLDFNLGELLAIGASLAYASYMLTTQRARTHVDTLTFMAISAAASITVLWIACRALGAPLTGYSVKAWSALLGMGLLSQLGGWLAINFALGHLRAAHVSVSLLGQAVVTTLLAMPILGEFPAANQMLGGVLVLVGIYVVNRRKAEEVVPEAVDLPAISPGESDGN
jgi:drug/metabolite transporter (DMT)-like permease